MQGETQGGRKNTLLTFNGSFGAGSASMLSPRTIPEDPEEGAAMLKEYREKYSQDIY